MSLSTRSEVRLAQAAVMLAPWFLMPSQRFEALESDRAVKIRSLMRVGKSCSLRCTARRRKEVPRGKMRRLQLANRARGDAGVCMELLCTASGVDSPCAHFARRRRVKMMFGARSASMARWDTRVIVEV